MRSRRFFLYGLASLVSANALAQPRRTEFVSPAQFGAVGDGRKDDTLGLTLAAEAASRRGVPLMLGNAHRISAPVPIHADVEIVAPSGGNAVFSSPARKHAIFRSTARNLNLFGITASGLSGIVEIVAPFDRVEVSGCDFTGVDNQVTNFAIHVAQGMSGGEVAIHHNRFQKCTPYFGEGARIDDLRFDDNQVIDAIRHVIRALDPADPPPDRAMTPARFHCHRNRIHGINTDFPDRRGQVARFVQLSARESLHIANNHIEDVIGDGGTATVVYWQYGSLTFENNTVINVRSGGKTGERVISDKLHASSAARYRHRIAGNVFDQSSVPAENSPTAIVHFFAAHNVVAEGDTFVGCSCPAYRVWQSVDAATTPSNFVFRDARLLQHRHPIVVSLVQQMQNVQIEGFEVHGLANTAGVSVHGSTEPRLVDIMMSFSNGRALENVSIRNNRVSSGAPDTVIARVYRNPRAVRSPVRKIDLVGNVLSGGAALISFGRGAAVGAVRVENNIGMNVFSGPPPRDFIQRSNRTP